MIINGIEFLRVPSGVVYKEEVAGFLLGRTPVTNGQFKRFLDCVGHPISDPILSEPFKPVVGVSWELIENFCKWFEDSRRTR
jgi:formylglycine-generating enzyme required for sulfatase activity